MSKGGETPSPVEKTHFVDASGNRVTRYRTSPPTQFPQLPYIDRPRTADDDDDDVGSLFRFDSSRYGVSPTSWDDEDEVHKVVSSRTSTPGKLRSMLLESGIGSFPAIGSRQTETEVQQPTEDVVTQTPTARRLSYGAQPSDDYIQPTIPIPLPTPPTTTERASASILPRSSQEPRPSWASPSDEYLVTRTSLDAVVDPAPSSKFVTALSVLPTQRAEADVELQRIRQSFSSQSVAVEDVPDQPSSTTSKAAALHRRRAGSAATSDVPVQPSSSRQARRSSKLDVTDVALQPSRTKQPSSAYSKPSAPSFDEISQQRLKILRRPPDDEYTPMLQTPLVDSGWETVYEEDLAQSGKPYPFYRTPVMSSSLRSSSPQTKTRRSWARLPPGGTSRAHAPAGGWSQRSERRYTVPRLSPPKFIQRPVSDIMFSC